MKAKEWLDLIAADEVQCDWTTVTTKTDEHVGEFRVTTDALRHRTKRNRMTGSARTQQLVADALGALLMTSKLTEERWAQATVRVLPQTGNVTKDVEGIAHSSRIDRAIEKTTDTREGDWLVADPCKTWILDVKCSERKAVNHGWIVPVALCKYASNRGDGRPGWTWSGVPVNKCHSIPDAFIIQNRGSAHDLDHHDYSQMFLLVHGDCVIDGTKMRTTDVYTSPKLAGLVTFDRKPLSWVRQPGVTV